MRIFNPKRTQELQLEDLDLNKGRLVSSTMQTTNEEGETFTERIFVYLPNSYVKRRNELIAEMRLLKSKLRATDYQAIKFAEGELSAAEYCETKNQRKAWRDRLNEHEVELAALKEA